MVFGEERSEVYVEGWAAGYGSVNRIEPDDEGGDAVATLVEDDELRPHGGRDDDRIERLAFVDGVRRVEASLYKLVDGRYARAIAGAFACGCVVIDDAGASFEPPIVERLIVWGSGMTDALPSVSGGWGWTLVSVAGDDVQAPLEALQARMRLSEGRLAEATATTGTLVIADGPLNFSLRSHEAVVGYVKTHRRALLGPADHARVSSLAAGERSSVFRIGDERYSCYLRLSDDPESGPWAAISRLEFSAAMGLASAIRMADALTARLPRYAGVAYRDPRAPQNLQPIGALEKQLRRHLGAEALADRAVREAVRARRSGAAA